MNYYCSREASSKGARAALSQESVFARNIKRKRHVPQALKSGVGGGWECVFTQIQLLQIKTDKLRNRSDLTWPDPPQRQSVLEC